MIKIDNQGIQKKPHAGKKSGNNSKYVELGLIGDAIAVKVSELTKHAVSQDTIRLLYISSRHNAIGYCTLQYDFYLKKGMPEQTPVYLYISDDNSVMKMADRLGDLNAAINNLNKKGAGFVLASKALK